MKEIDAELSQTYTQQQINIAELRQRRQNANYAELAAINIAHAKCLRSMLRIIAARAELLLANSAAHALDLQQRGFCHSESDAFE